MNGEAGMKAVLTILRDELDATMGMCGRRTVESIDMDTLVTVSPLLSLFPQSQDFR